MARKSFTFKRTTVDSGSYLQREPAALGVDDDSALRGDFYTTTPDGDQGTKLLFDADPTSYTSSLLKWETVGALATTLTVTPQATKVLIVYSASGYPQTVSDGSILVSTTSAVGRFPHTGLPSGKWAYYSLFVLYESTSYRSWYEHIGSLEVLIPFDYGSTEDLWKRIPRHYRMTDRQLAENPDDNTSHGPLYRTLDVFGWDINRMRTLTDYQMIAKDPDVAEVEVLDALAYELGSPLGVTALGPSRLRRLLHNVRINNASKGTITGVEQALGALTGSVVEFTPSRPERLTAAQRAFSGGVVTTTPTGNQWAYTTAASVTCSASAGGLAAVRSAGTGYLMTVLTTPVSISQASQYRTFYDVIPVTGASVIGSLMSTTRYAASSWTLAASGGVVSEGPQEWQQQTSGAVPWYQAPQDHGIVGDGTFSSTTAYLHIIVVLGPGPSSLLIKNPSLKALDTYPYTLDVYSERANLIRDPQFVYAINNASSASANYWNWTHDGGGGPASVARSGSALVITAPNQPSTAAEIPPLLTTATLWLDADEPPQVTINNNTTNNLTPIRTGIEYNFSIVDSSSSISRVALISRTYGLVAASEATYREVETADGPRRYWLLYRAYADPWLPLDVSDCYLQMHCRPTVTTTRLSAPLFEYSYRSGEYFDGENINGGWLRGDSFSGTADYRWGTAGEDQSFSYYATDYVRMLSAVQKMLPFLLPVTETDATVRFNRIFGYSGSDMP